MFNNNQPINLQIWQKILSRAGILREQQINSLPLFRSQYPRNSDSIIYVWVTGGLSVSSGRQSNLCVLATAPTGVLTSGTAGQHR